MAPAAHLVTTRHLGAAYPFASEPGLGGKGIVIGRDLLGGAFVHDPFELYRSGILTNPNMVVFGQIGRGKSAFVKTYLWRQAVFGRTAWVVDPKGEYGALAAAWGVEPVALRPGGRIRLNPLDAPPSSEGNRAGPVVEETIRRRSELLASLATASLGRALLPSERTAVELAVAHVSESGTTPTLPLVVDAMLSPSTIAARTVRSDRAGLAADGRQVALELRRLVAGDLQGMFDGPTSPGIDLGGPLVVLDLSAVYHSGALGVLMTCAAAWLQAGLSRNGLRISNGGPAGPPEGPEKRADGVIVVVDEAWAILANLGVARWLQSSWKLSRAFGVANVAVLHRVSDLDSAGPAGSEQVGLARGLLADSETTVVYAQPTSEVERARELLGLSTTEAELVPNLHRGVALWKVGTRSFLVQHLLAPAETRLVDTDGRMRTGAVR
ncbi:MAG TPA: hypothetical protein VEJ87_06985 [Acidimicrobiales bacterium]|nr:hypothetical protein [Acidimicrobiales bacterium]